MTFLENFEDVYSLAVEEFQENLEPIFAIYVGSGWRPRWTSMILDKPALIIDLGSVAELKLTGRSEMRGLLAFNLGHLYHMWKRDELNRLKESREDPFFRLYAEGFAQLSEHLILKRESWHMVRSEGWLKACEEREGMLAEEYLRSAEAGDVEAFLRSLARCRGIEACRKISRIQVRGEPSGGGVNLGRSCWFFGVRCAETFKSISRRIS